MAAEKTASLAAAWPLFGLRIRSERLVLRLATDDDLVDGAQSGVRAGLPAASLGPARPLDAPTRGRSTW